MCLYRSQFLFARRRKKPTNKFKCSSMLSARAGCLNRQKPIELYKNKTKAWKKHSFQLIPVKIRLRNPSTHAPYTCICIVIVHAYIRNRKSYNLLWLTRNSIFSELTICFVFRSGNETLLNENGDNGFGRRRNLFI